MTTSLQTAQAQNLAMMVSEAVSEAVDRTVKPLAELTDKQTGIIDKQYQDLQKLNRENGELTTELCLLKKRLEALETAWTVQEAAKAQQPMTSLIYLPPRPQSPHRPPSNRQRKGAGGNGCWAGSWLWDLL